VAIVDRFSPSRLWDLLVDSDPSEVLPAPIGSRATLNVAPGTQWDNIDGNTSWAIRGGPGVDPNGLYHDAARVKTSTWSSLHTLLTGPPAGVVANSVAIAAVGPAANRGLLFTPAVFNGGLDQTSGYGVAVPAGQWIIGVDVEILWQGVGSIVFSTALAIFMVGFSALDGTGLRGLGAQIGNRYLQGDTSSGIRWVPFTAGTLGNVTPTLGTGIHGYGYQMTRAQIFLQRLTDNTIWAYICSPEYGGMKGTSSVLPASAGAGALHLAMMLPIGTGTVPRVMIRSAPTYFAALPWEATV